MSDYRDDRGSDRGYERRSDRDDRNRGPDRQRNPNTVFVGGLSTSTTDREVDAAFGKYGKIGKIQMKNGFAFVEFEDRRDAEDAIKELNDREIDGNRIRCEFSKGGSDRREGGDRPPRRDFGGDKPRIPPRSEWRVLVEGISSSVSWQDLKDTMRRVGDVVYVDVQKNASPPFGIVEFRSEDEMKRAIQDFDNTEIGGSKVGVKQDPEKDRPRIFFQKTDRPPRRDDYGSDRRDDYRRDDRGRDDYRSSGREERREEPRRDDYRRDDYRRDDYRRDRE